MVVIPKVEAAFVLLAMVPAPPTSTTSDDCPSKPLNNPKLSFGKKCNDDVWSYVWIYNKDKELQANEKDCEKL